MLRPAAESQTWPGVKSEWRAAARVRVKMVVVIVVRLGDYLPSVAMVGGDGEHADCCRMTPPLLAGVTAESLVPPSRPEEDAEGPETETEKQRGPVDAMNLHQTARHALWP